MSEDQTRKHSTRKAPDDEMYWQSVREQYDLPSEFINLENGYFGVQSRPVLEAHLAHQRQLNRDGSYFLREQFPARHAAVLQSLATLCGVSADELVITRNLVESMNILIQGYPFRAGDEVILAAHDYDSVIDTLEMTRQRKSLSLIYVSVPTDPESDAQIVTAYESAITPKTRVILVTHVVHRTGQIMPVAAIAAMARRHGVDVMIDAAHSFAQIPYQMPELGGDFVAVNLHKWLGAPLGIALLYIRKPRIAELTPLFGDISHAADDIRKLVNIGTVPAASILAIQDALNFHHQIGAENKEARLRYLTQYWLSKVRALPLVESLTPFAPERSCAIAAINIRGINAQQVVSLLMSEFRIFTVTREINGSTCVRVTPHLFTTLAELDLLVSAISTIVSRVQSGQQMA